jgi:hypothetical protein
MHKKLNHVLAVAMLVAAFGILVANPAAFADDIAITPRGEYAKIDTRLAIATIQILTNGSAEDRQSAIDRIKASPDRYPPPVLFALGSVLFQGGKKDEGVFWFFAGLVRGSYDASRCADLSAREAVSVLSRKYDQPMKEYMLKDLDKLQEMAPRVVEWDRKTPYNYDHRWINLYGMDATLSGLDATDPASPPPPLSLPKEQWKDLAETSRAQLLASIQELVAHHKKNDGKSH